MYLLGRSGSARLSPEPMSAYLCLLEEKTIYSSYPDDQNIMARSSVGKDGRLIAASEELGARNHVSARESEVVGSARRRSPAGRFESPLPSLSSVKNLLCERRCLLVERGHNGLADGVRAKFDFESLPFRRTTHQTSLRTSGVRKIGETQHSK